jgi:hypothetical protein
VSRQIEKFDSEAMAICLSYLLGSDEEVEASADRLELTHPYRFEHDSLFAVQSTM